MRNEMELISVLDGLIDNRDDFLLTAKHNHYLDYNQLRCEYDTMIETLEWVLKKDKEFKLLKKFFKIMEEDI
jgi:hypothetical protein